VRRALVGALAIAAVLVTLSACGRRAAGSAGAPPASTAASTSASTAQPVSAPTAVVAAVTSSAAQPKRTPGDLGSVRADLSDANAAANAAAQHVSSGDAAASAGDTP